MAFDLAQRGLALTEHILAALRPLIEALDLLVFGGHWHGVVGAVCALLQFLSYPLGSRLHDVQVRVVCVGSVELAATSFLISEIEEFALEVNNFEALVLIPFVLIGLRVLENYHWLCF